MIMSMSCFAQTTSKRGTIRVKKPGEITESMNIISDPYDDIVYAAEKMPEFPGGYTALNNYVSKNLTYPKAAVEKSCSGTIYINFVVEKDGTLSKVMLLKGIPGCPECDAEALRVVNSMPKWRAGSNKGAPVRAQYTLPIDFTLK